MKLTMKTTPATIALAALLAASAHAQNFQAQISGTVTDSTGAVVPNAQIVARNIANGSNATTLSNQAGLYTFPALSPAEYRVTCSMHGFKTIEQGPLTLQVNQVLALDFQLQPGATSEQIVVTGAPPPLDTADASLGQVVTTRSIEGLPLNFRDPMALIGLTPGVTFGSGFSDGTGINVGRNFFRSDFNVGGGRSGSQEILLDGVPNTTPDINRALINPPVDSVQEFKVQANSYDAEFGRTSGSIVNVITKPGTNALHGVAYDFERHSVLDANNFFNNQKGLANPSFQRHQFGVDLGGPIIKDKWFFFGDYEGLRQGFPGTTISTVPTDLQRRGDFSQTFASNGALIQIYDPSTLVTLQNGTRRRSQFPGNVVPTSRFDPVAANTLPFLPGPNAAGAAVTGQNNYIYSANTITNSDKGDIRSDFNPTEKTRMFFRFSRQGDERIRTGNLPLPAGGGGFTYDDYTQALTDITHVFSPTLVTDVQFSFGRGLAQQVGASNGFDLTKLGYSSAYASQLTPQFPIFTIGDVVGTSNGGDSFTQYQPRNVFVARGSVNSLHGKHGLKFGGEWRGLHFNEAQLNAASGTFNFGRTFTQGPDPITSSTTSGYGLASFLLGTPASGSINRVNPISTRGSYYGLFVQDDWRVTSHLTLNLGLRWDVTLGNQEKYNRLAYFDPGAANPLGAAAGLSSLTGLLQWTGQTNPGNQQQTDWNNFGPRVGFAYSPDGKTVIRGGYGIAYIPRTVQGNGGGAVEAFRTTTMLATIDGVTPANFVSNPFPGGILPALNDRDPLANTGSTVTAPYYGNHDGYSQSWSGGVQRELPWGLVLDTYYWGNKGTGLQETWNVNQMPDQYLSLGSRLNDQVPNPFYNVITSGSLNGTTVSRQQLLRPFPQYTGNNGVTRVYIPAGNSTYHAVTGKVERRLSSTLTFTAQYTFSKAIDDVRTPVDVYNRRLEKSLSAFDTPHQFVFSGVYRLPFGRGRIWGGWDLNGILRLQSGQPVTISPAGGSRSGNNNGQSAKLDNPTIDRWFNPSVFSPTPANTYPTVGPYLPDVFTDATKNIDAVIVKTFEFGLRDKRITAQFRSEFYNLFNHPQFAAPNGTQSSQSFGTVTSQFNNPRDIQFGLKLKF